LRIGTRGSPLALAQANQVRDRLGAAHAGLSVAITVIKTTGDRIQDRPLAEAGGKGLFTKEIEEALIERTIDLAVHSMKDVPTRLPPGLTIDCLLPREDPRDVFLSRGPGGLDGLPAGARVGTSSLRRRAMLLHRRPDLQVVEFRGNVETRLRKLEEGTVDATVLALAGLRRLAITPRTMTVLSADEMLPAVAQGAIGIECREDDAAVRRLLQPLSDPATVTCVAAERALLTVLDGSCRTPIAGLAEIVGDQLWLRGAIVSPDGARLFAGDRRGGIGDGVALGSDLGGELRRKGGPDFFKNA